MGLGNYVKIAKSEGWDPDIINMLAESRIRHGGRGIEETREWEQKALNGEADFQRKFNYFLPEDGEKHLDLNDERNKYNVMAALKQLSTGTLGMDTLEPVPYTDKMGINNRVQNLVSGATIATTGALVGNRIGRMVGQSELAPIIGTGLGGIGGALLGHQMSKKITEGQTSDYMTGLPSTGILGAAVNGSLGADPDKRIRTLGGGMLGGALGAGAGALANEYLGGNYGDLPGVLASGFIGNRIGSALAHGKTDPADRLRQQEQHL